MIESGLYRMNFRGLTLAECWRFGGFKMFPIALVLKLFGKKGPYIWLPSKEAEQNCEADDISEEARSRLLPLVGELEKLGYHRGTYSRMIGNRNPDECFRDGAGYRALHDDGIRFISIGYIHREDQVDPDDDITETKKTVFITGGLLMENNNSVCVLNHKNYMDDGGLTKYIFLKNASLADVADQMARVLKSSTLTFKIMADPDELEEILQEIDLAVSKSRIDRKLYKKVPRYEEIHALEKSKMYFTDDRDGMVRDGSGGDYHAADGQDILGEMKELWKDCPEVSNLTEKDFKDINAGIRTMQKVEELRPREPYNWEDAAGWERYYNTLLNDETYWEIEHCLAEFNVHSEYIYSWLESMSGYGSKTIWFPGCGLSRLPKIFAECGLSSHATDISDSAIAFQASRDNNNCKKIIKGIKKLDRKNKLIEFSNPCDNLICETHDFFTPYHDAYFDIIYNENSLQGFTPEKQDEILKLHHASLKPSGLAIFATMNIPGPARHAHEERLKNAGFSVPQYGIEDRYYREIRETGIENVFFQGARPVIHAKDKSAGASREQELLDDIFGRYLTEIEKIVIGINDSMKKRKKVAYIVYNTG